MFFRPTVNCRLGCNFFDDEVENIKSYNLISYTTITDVKHIDISPNTLIFVDENELEQVTKSIKNSASKSNLEPNYMVRLNNICENIFLNLGFNNRDVSLSWCLPFLPNYKASILNYIAPESLLVF